MRRFLLTLLFLLSCQLIYAQQEIPVNTWRSHLPYNDAQNLTEAGDRIYCATRNGLFYYDQKDNTLNGLSKVEGFSDVFISHVAYDVNTKALFVAYQDGNLDIVRNNRILNITSLKGIANIKNLRFADGKCYIVTDIGISEYKIAKEEFGDSYKYIDSACLSIPYNDVAIVGDSVYAASVQGVQRAWKKEQFLASCESWQMVRKKDSCFLLASFGGKLWGAFQGGYLRYYADGAWTDVVSGDQGKIQSLEVNHGYLIASTPGMIYKIGEDLLVEKTPSNQQVYVIMDKNGTYWLANSSGIWGLKNGAVSFVNSPNGPRAARAHYMTQHNGAVWVATGSVNVQGAPNYDNSGFYDFFKGVWYNYSYFSGEVPDDARDIMQIKVDSLNNHLWVSSLDKGVIEYADNKFATLYNAGNTNGALPHTDTNSDNSSVAGLDFDSKRNLWMVSYRAPKPIIVRKANGQWHSFNIPGSHELLDLMVDANDNIWTYSFRSGTIAVYNPGKDIDTSTDDRIILLRNVKDQGNLPGTQILSIANDRNGQVWVGTDDGVAVFPDPSLIFSSNSYDAQKIWIRDGDNSGYLLTAQRVTAIAVDGGNRKWFGTYNGVWLTNPDGDKILAHYDVSNSPLISNSITSIAVNGETGEVFFGSELGIVSFRSAATEGKAKHEDVYAYPNPVRPGYDGPIAIKGLITDARVKITDVTGNLVYEMTAIGGQAIWNGRNFNGEKANSGVYYIFSTNIDGDETAVTKVLIVR